MNKSTFFKSILKIIYFTGFFIILLLPINLGLCIYAKSAFAITVEEMLEDPILEKRARDISAGLRCLVCQNQSIDDSDAELAQDLRRQVRDYLISEMTDDEIYQALQNKYGEFVLLSPPIQPSTYLLWLAPLIIILIGVFLIINLFRPASAKSNNSVFEDQTSVNEISRESVKIIQNTPNSATPKSQSSNLVRISIPFCILAVSLAVYLVLGRPDLLDQPLEKRQEVIAKTNQELKDRQMAALDNFKQAQKQVALTPNSLTSQFMLAATASQIGAIDDEINALKKALELSNDDPRIKSQLAEAFTRQADGQVTKDASRLISEVIKSRPNDIRALYLGGLEAFQKGAMREAVDIWKSATPFILSNSDLAVQMTADIARAAELANIDTPDLSFAQPKTQRQADNIQAIPEINTNSDAFQERLSQFSELSADGQKEFVEQMIEKLAERVQEQPDNFSGWLQLANAYISIEDNLSVENALKSASNAVISDQQRMRLIEFSLLTFPTKATATLAEQQLALLSETVLQSNSAKFLQGELARQQGDTKKAVIFWSDILKTIPPEAEQAKTLRNYIMDLK